MAGNKTGGQKAAAKNKAKDPDFYKKIGAIGGAKSRTGGFYSNRELARIAGAKGGRISRRRKAGDYEPTGETTTVAVPSGHGLFDRLFHRSTN